MVMKNKKKSKILKLSQKQCYITLKDHKPDFLNKLSCRIINPEKNFTDKPAKTNLDIINNLVKLISSLRQWKNTYEVLNWFNNLRNKSIKFDIFILYLNISATILKSSFNFTAGLTKIMKYKKELIRHCFKSV